MPLSVLTYEQHDEIRQRYSAGGVSQAALAAEFGVGQTTISKVVRQSHRLTTRGLLLREAQELRAVGKKRCSTCREAKAVEEFGRNRAKHDGMAQDCRDCGRAASRARHAANPEPGREQACQWAKDHPDAVRARSRKAASARRARIRNAFVEDVDPQVVFERDEGVCGVCDEACDRDEFDVDHIIPLALGGEHSYANVRVAHVGCNRRRGRSTSLSAVTVSGKEVG